MPSKSQETTIRREINNEKLAINKLQPENNFQKSNDEFFSKPLAKPKEDFFSRELKNNKIVLVD